MMKAIVTATFPDGAKWGWPGDPVIRLRNEDGSWGWVPEIPGERHDVGDVVDADGGWEWLSEREQKAHLAAVERKTAAERRIALVRQAQQLDKLELHHDKKTAAQLDRDIAEALGVRRRKKTR
ncbi:MAG TPA: hypothetical protein VLE97_05850 [Gaiellaceae bacterium]|nr:hypothetical protein [Gaiellaceae bacterium]